MHNFQFIENKRSQNSLMPESGPTFIILILAPSPDGNLILARQGNLYGAIATGGANGVQPHPFHCGYVCVVENVVIITILRCPRTNREE